MIAVTNCAVLSELYLLVLIPLSLTLTLFQGHINVKVKTVISHPINLLRSDFVVHGWDHAYNATLMLVCIQGRKCMHFLTQQKHHGGVPSSCVGVPSSYTFKLCRITSIEHYQFIPVSDELDLISRLQGHLECKTASGMFSVSSFPMKFKVCKRLNTWMDKITSKLLSMT